VVRQFDAASGRELVRLISMNEGNDWLAITPEGYFHGSEQAQQLVTWRVGDKVFPVELYESRFGRPDLVARAFRGQDIGDQPAVPGDRTPPTVALELDEAQADSARVRATVTLGAANATIQSLRITVDGRDITAERAQAIARDRPQGRSVVYRATVDFPPGRDSALVAAKATDDFGLGSATAELRVQRPGAAPPVRSTLYVLAVGITHYKNPLYDLDFAHADAEDLAKALERQKGRAFADVQSLVLTNGKATKDEILKGLAWLQRSCTATDVAVILFCGHGVFGSPGKLFYFTHEGNLDALRDTCLSWEDLAKALNRKQLKAYQVVFLSDCCHAGAFGGLDERAASQENLSQQFKDAGVLVYTSSKACEKSSELREHKHGAFTFALLEGLAGGGDPGRTKDKLSFSDLQAYVTARVPKLTGGRQHPWIPLANNFDPGLVLAHLK
jgi:hypothetical protein